MAGEVSEASRETRVECLGREEGFKAPHAKEPNICKMASLTRISCQILLLFIEKLNGPESTGCTLSWQPSASGINLTNARHVQQQQEGFTASNVCMCTCMVK